MAAGSAPGRISRHKIRGRCAERVGGLDEVAGLEAPDLGPHDPGDQRPRGQPQQQDEPVEPGAEQRDDDHRKEKPRDDLDELREPHDHVVRQPTAPARDGADGDAQEQREHGHGATRAMSAPRARRR